MSLMQQCLWKAMSVAAVVCLSEVPYLSLKPLSLSGRLNSLLVELSALSMGHSQLLLQVPGTHLQLLHLQVQESVMSHHTHAKRRTNVGQYLLEESRLFVSNEMALHAIGSLDCTVSIGHSMLLLQCPGSRLHPPATSAATPFVLTPE